MKMPCLFLLSADVAFSFSVCASSGQFAGVVSGSSVGGVFGSGIGGIFGGPRGHDIGTAVGMLAGGAVGAAATAPRGERRSGSDEQEVGYGRYQEPGYRNSGASAALWQNLEVSNVQYADDNGNRCLDPGERASITMDIYNRGNVTIYDIAPQITCSDRNATISPTAIVSALESGQGFRYRAEIIAPRRIKSDFLTFTVSFGQKRQRVTAKTFRIRAGR